MAGLQQQKILFGLLPGAGGRRRQLLHGLGPRGGPRVQAGRGPGLDEAAAGAADPVTQSVHLEELSNFFHGVRGGQLFVLNAEEDAGRGAFLHGLLGPVHGRRGGGQSHRRRF
jgi:hypothetical protein